MLNYKQQKVNKSVFRAYDIRGIIGKDLDEDAFYSIGLALAVYLKNLDKDFVYVGRDGRLSSASLTKALIQGLLDSAINVCDLGAVATPVLYYATADGIYDSGLMVTGSHNPADYNGIKMVLAGKTLVQEDIEYLYRLVSSGDRLYGTGVLYDSKDVLTQYKNKIKEIIKIKPGCKVVVDCGNGIAGDTIPGILQDLGCEVVPLYCEVDGRFPNHHPDPTVEENLKDLQIAVKKHKADLGFAFDGDADRLGVITQTGQIIWPDKLMMVFAQHILKKNPGATIVYDVKCSRFLGKVIQDANGVAKMSPTGHSIVKKIMKEENALLAGEMSGHIFFKDRWYGFDDALYSACRLLEILSDNTIDLDSLCSNLPISCATPELKIAICDTEKFAFIEKIKQNIDFPEANIIDIDGLRVEFPQGWGLIRASNTTPCLVTRFEANNLTELQNIQNIFRDTLKNIEPSIEVPF